MESVEELCEYIALIHRSRNILEGKLSDIKKTHRLNLFRVRWTPFNGATPDTLRLGAPMTVKEFDPEDQTWDFTVRLEDRTQGELLKCLTEQGSISSFQEVIPSANDIFIQTVQKQEANA